MSQMGLGCVKTKSDLVVMPSGRQIFAFFRSPHDRRAQNSRCGYTAQSFHTARVKGGSGQLRQSRRLWLSSLFAANSQQTHAGRNRKCVPRSAGRWFQANVRSPDALAASRNNGDRRRKALSTGRRAKPSSCVDANAHSPKPHQAFAFNAEERQLVDGIDHPQGRPALICIKRCQSDLRCYIYIFAGGSSEFEMRNCAFLVKPRRGIIG